MTNKVVAAKVIPNKALIFKTTLLAACLSLSAFQVEAAAITEGAGKSEEPVETGLFHMPLSLSDNYLHKPSADDVQSVINYYYQAESTLPVLTDIKLCEGIYKTGQLKNMCKGELDPNAIKPGQSAFVWMNYLVPKSTRSTVLMQVKHNGVARQADDFSVLGSIRYRTWKKVTFDRVGLWEIPLYQDNAEGLKEIDRFFVHVDKPMPQENESADIALLEGALKE